MATEQISSTIRVSHQGDKTSRAGFAGCSVQAGSELRRGQATVRPRASATIDASARTGTDPGQLSTRPRHATAHRRGVLGADGLCVEHLVVKCPICMYASQVSGAAAPLDDPPESRYCESAARAVAVRVHPLASRARDSLRRTSETPPPSPEHCRVEEVMRRDTLCVRDDVSLESVQETFLGAGLTGAPVVTADGRAVGFVSMTDLVRDYHDLSGTSEAQPERLPGWLGDGGWQLERPVRTVSDVMSAPVICVSAFTSLARAAAVMAFEGIHQLVVTSADHRVIGALSATDVLRWMASRHGFILMGRDGASVRALRADTRPANVEPA